MMGRTSKTTEAAPLHFFSGEGGSKSQVGGMGSVDRNDVSQHSSVTITWTQYYEERTKIAGKLYQE